MRMFYYLLRLLNPNVVPAHALQHPGFRMSAAFLTALVLSLLSGTRFIALAKTIFRSRAREFTPQSHRAKDDTPTMGGLFVIAIVFSTCFLWCNIIDKAVLLFFVCFFSFGLIGALDDYHKISLKKGISARNKCLLQIFCAVLCMILFYYAGFSTRIEVPFFASVNADIGLYFIVWGALVFVATTNAVNLTDGLDGLAIGSLIPNFALFSLIAYVSSMTVFYQNDFISSACAQEIAIMCAALTGASIGFLWYNVYPAALFMGDVGSLALGAGLACIALMLKYELILLVTGWLFVGEAFSVIIQVLSYKYRGKRVFKMAPIHHHFELAGWKETTITVISAAGSFLICVITVLLFITGASFAWR